MSPCVRRHSLRALSHPNMFNIQYTSILYIIYEYMKRTSHIVTAIIWVQFTTGNCERQPDASEADNGSKIGWNGIKE